MANGPDVRRTSRDSGEAQGGLPCPECGGRIAFSLDDLLVRHAFACRTRGCGTVLRLDQRSSGEAMDVLRELRGRLREVRAAL